MSSLEKNLLTLIRKATKQDGATDISAQVLRVDGSTAWVHIDGGVDETPVERTIDCSTGDTVRVRLSGGQAYIIGNNSAPPTDDTVANVALTRAGSAQVNAQRALTVADEISQTVVGEYVASGTSGVHRLSSTLQQTAGGVNIYNDIDTVGDSYAHIDGTGFAVRKVATAGVIDDDDPEVAHFGEAIKIGQNLTGTNNSGTIAIGSGNLDTTGTHSMAMGWANNAGLSQSHIRSTGLGSSTRGSADGGGTITASGEGASAEGMVGEDSTIIASGDGALARGLAQMDGDIAASGDGATAQGKADDDGNIRAEDEGSFASGFAFGGDILASAEGSIAEGYSEYEISATAKGARASGYSKSGQIQASGIGSYAGGDASDEDIEASGAGAFAHGIGVTAGEDGQAVFGKNNDNQADTLLEVGNGTGHGVGEQSNAFEVYDNGKFGTPGLWFSVNASGEPCVTFEDGN